MADQKPSIGRIVHYHSHGSPNGQHKPEPRAAIVTAVHTDTVVDLMVCNPTGLYFDRSTVQGEGPGQWSWPPRV